MLIVATSVITLVAIITLIVGLTWDGYGALVSLAAFVLIMLPLFVAGILLTYHGQDNKDIYVAPENSAGDGQPLNLPCRRNC